MKGKCYSQPKNLCAWPCSCACVWEWSKSVVNHAKCKRTEREQEVKRGVGVQERFAEIWRGESVNKTERVKQTMIGNEEKRQEEVLLIYTLKSPQILHDSTQVSIEGKEAIYSIFYFFNLSSLWCVNWATVGVLWTVCVFHLCCLYKRVSVLLVHGIPINMCMRVHLHVS